MKTKWTLAAALLSTLSAAAYADGDVLAAVDPGSHTLRLTGDAAANTVEVAPGATLGAFTVTGKNGTTVNGLASVSVTDGLSIVADMGAGDDRLELTGIRVRYALRVTLGDGDDALAMSGVRVRGRTSVRAGSGADRVIATDSCMFRGIVAVAGGDGADVVEFHDAFFSHFVRVDTGAGNDSVVFDGSSFSSVAPLFVDTRAGDDSLELRDCSFHDDVECDMGGDADHVVIDDSNFGKDCVVSGGGGNEDDLSVRSGNNFKVRRPPHFRSFES